MLTLHHVRALSTRTARQQKSRCPMMQRLRKCLISSQKLSQLQAMTLWKNSLQAKNSQEKKLSRLLTRALTNLQFILYMHVQVTQWTVLTFLWTNLHTQLPTLLLTQAVRTLTVTKTVLLQLFASRQLLTRSLVRCLTSR